MKKQNKNILICKDITYYSYKDEYIFFEWIKKIRSIIKFEGKNDELYLYVKNNKISGDDLRELLALYYRYKIDMKQLKIFLNDTNKSWFYEGPHKGYWHKRVFG